MFLTARGQEEEDEEGWKEGSCWPVVLQRGILYKSQVV